MRDNTRDDKPGASADRGRRAGGDRSAEHAAPAASETAEGPGDGPAPARSEAEAMRRAYERMQAVWLTRMGFPPGTSPPPGLDTRPIWLPLVKRRGDKVVSFDGIPIVYDETAPDERRRLRPEAQERRAAGGAAVRARAGEEADYVTLRELCRDRVADLEASAATATEKSEELLLAIQRLRRLTKADQAAEAALLRDYKDAGIRITKRTTNVVYTPMVALVAGKRLSSATRSRHASTLLLFEEEGEPGDLIGFVRRNGGIDGCAKLMTERRNAAAGAAEDRRGAAAKLIEERLAGAPKIELPAKLVAGGDEGLVMLLVKPVANGGCAVLGQRPAATSALRTFAPVEPTPTAAGAARRRR